MEKKSYARTIIWVVSLVVILIVGIIAGVSFKKIDVGEVGVKVTLGKVEGEKREGIVWYNPFVTDIIVFDIREKLFEPKNIQVFSKDAQEVALSIAVNFAPQANKMIYFYSTYGTNYLEQLVPPTVYSIAKEVAGQFNAVDMITQREKMQNDLAKRLKEELSKKYINVSKVSITGLGLNAQFTEAVNQKVIAVQEAERAKNVTQRIEEEAKQKVIAAEAEAKAMKIKSEALKQNSNLVEFNAVEKWDGKLPVYMMGNGALPFINFTPKGEKQ